MKKASWRSADFEAGDKVPEWISTPDRDGGGGMTGDSEPSQTQCTHPKIKSISKSVAPRELDGRLEFGFSVVRGGEHRLLRSGLIVF